MVESEQGKSEARDENVGGIGGRRTVEPEADKQVGAQADQLPEDEGDEEVVRKHEADHRGAEGR